MSEIEDDGGGVSDEWGTRRPVVVYSLNDDLKFVKEENGGGVYADGSNSVMEEGSMEGNVRKKGSIAERQAAMCGFDASRINVARFRSASPLSSSVVQSPYLTIPCGISPTALLDSPIMLPNSQLSPTTGTFPLPPINHRSSVLNSPSHAEIGERDGEADSSYMFQPHDDLFFWSCISELENKPPVSSELPLATMNGADSCGEAKVLTNTIPNAYSIDNQPTSFRKPMNGGENLFLEGYKKETYPLSGIVRNSEDGYNWRKYGQKLVKGSEYPRSYYKCTHPNCLVKKIVERSLDGQITEIIYKNAHNHQIPHLTSDSMASFSGMSEIGEGVKVEGGGDVLRNTQMGSNGSDSTSVQTDNSDPLSSTQGKSVGIFELVGTPEFSSTLGDDDDEINEGKFSPDDDRSDSKRRKKGSFLMEPSMVSRALREPRVVVQIESEIDILDDGYRWRKYGQKVVKGNPNPRSYYKCTSAGCLVRKHVERSSVNPKAVITTYEGKHNHEIPASRNSKNTNLDVTNLPLSVPTRHSNHRELPRITGISSKVEPQIQHHPLRVFERKLGAEFTLPPSLVGNFGASSMYFENSMCFGSLLPDFPMSLPLSIPVCATPVQGSSFGGTQEFVRENNARFVRPKQELDDDMFYTRLPIEDHDNTPFSSSIHGQVNPNFPS